MEITPDKIRIRGWQFACIILLGFAFIGSMTYTSINWQKAKVEETKKIQEEKSNRGHWLWGRWQDVSKKKE